MLRFGTLGITRAGGGDASSGWTPEHHFAHDDAYAYDSAGRHPLPYHGVHGEADYYELDGDPDDWAPLSEEGSGEPDVVAAQEHARRQRILDGGYGPRPGPDQGAASGLITGPEFRGPSGVRRAAAPGRRAPGSPARSQQIQPRTRGRGQ